MKKKSILLDSRLRIDPIDERDYKFSSIPDSEKTIKTGSTLPAKHSWISEMSPVKYQGRLGCHDEETEILTNNGWKKFPDLNKSDLAATVNTSNHCIEYYKPINYISSHYKGPLYHFNHSKGLDCMVTPNHRMYVKTWNSKNVKMNEQYSFIKADNLGWYNGLITHLKWEDGSSEEFITMPDVNIGTRTGAKKSSIRKGKKIKMKDFVTFLGLYMAEGCSINSPRLVNGKKGLTYRVDIAASDNNPKKEEVLKILKKLPYTVGIFKTRAVISNKSLFTYLKPIGNVYTKRVPRFIMNLDNKLIEKFLYGYFLGDGHYFKNTDSRICWSVSEGLIDDIQELILKTGRWSTIIKNKKKSTIIRGRIIDKKNLKTCYSVIERCSNTKLSIDRNRHSSIIDYDGYVYCVEVPNHTLITRRNGKVMVSGNSCVAFSVCALKEWQEKKEHEAEVKAGKQDRREDQEYNFSEQWAYWNAKKIDPWPGSEGTNFRSVLKVLHKIGVPIEAAWPYSDDPINIGQPKKWAHLIARWSTIDSYWRVDDTVAGLKRALVEGPVLLGMKCFEEMYGTLINGKIPYPIKPHEIWSCHAVLAVGFNDEDETICIKNSWSKFFGDRGYGYIPYKYVDHFCGNSWAVKDISVTPDMLKGTRKLID